MAKTTATKTRKTQPPPSALTLRKATLDDARKLKRLNKTIAAECRAVERAEDAANVRLERLLSVYCERADKVLVDRAAWNQIRDANEDFRQRLSDLEEAAAAHNELEHAVPVAKEARA